MEPPVIDLPTTSALPMLLAAAAVAGALTGVAFFISARRDEMTARKMVGMVAGFIAALVLAISSVATTNNANHQRSDQIVKAVKNHFDVALTGQAPAEFGVGENRSWDTIGSVPGIGGQRCTLKDEDSSNETATLQMTCDTLKIDRVR